MNYANRESAQEFSEELYNERWADSHPDWRELTVLGYTVTVWRWGIEVRKWR